LEGFQKLAKECQECCDKHELRGTLLAMEPTGVYGEALAYWWEDSGGTVVWVNPMHTKRVKELDDNSPLKSDPTDAKVIADLASQGKYLECHLPRGVFAELRNLVAQRDRYQSHRTAVINQLHQCVDRLFPELIREFSSMKVKSYRNLLARYPEPKELASVSLEGLTALLLKWSRGSFGEEKARRLIYVASKSVGVNEGATIIAADVKSLIKQVESIENCCDAVEMQIEECLKRTPGAALLMTIPGFGPVTVAGILANTGDLTEYQHPEELLKFAGLNLFEISSGTHKGRRRITKRGRAHLRKILYMAALRSARRDSPFSKYYQQLVERRVNSTASLVALMRKLLRVCWSLVRNNTGFEVERLKPTTTQKKAA
jgi:transposase